MYRIKITVKLPSGETFRSPWSEKMDEASVSYEKKGLARICREGTDMEMPLEDGRTTIFLNERAIKESLFFMEVEECQE